MVSESTNPSVIGILALQGSFALHRRALEQLGVTTRLVRRGEELDGIEGLILPGGESTVFSKLSREFGLFDRLRAEAAAGLPLFGTCAGAIFLGSSDDDTPCLEAVPLDLARNAYGRQVDSFERELTLDLQDGSKAPFLCIFIRAPRILLPKKNPDLRVEILGREGADAVLVRSQNILLSTFHPELTEDRRVHRYFIGMVEQYRKLKTGAHPERGGAAGKRQTEQGQS